MCDGEGVKMNVTFLIGEKLCVCVCVCVCACVNDLYVYNGVCVLGIN